MTGADASSHILGGTAMFKTDALAIVLLTTVLALGACDWDSRDPASPAINKANAVEVRAAANGYTQIVFDGIVLDVQTKDGETIISSGAVGALPKGPGSITRILPTGTVEVSFADNGRLVTLRKASPSGLGPISFQTCTIETCGEDGEGSGGTTIGTKCCERERDAYFSQMIDNGVLASAVAWSCIPNPANPACIIATAAYAKAIYDLNYLKNTLDSCRESAKYNPTCVQNGIAFDYGRAKREVQG
jgi:hypothetical protein